METLREPNSFELPSLMESTAFELPSWVNQERHIYGYLNEYDKRSWELTMKNDRPRANYIFKCACETKSKIETINFAFKILDKLKADGKINFRLSILLQFQLGCPTKLEAQKLVVCWENAPWT